MIYDKLTPFEYLEFVAGLWGIEAAEAEIAARALIERLGLGPHAHERCQGFSKGMRQKVALAGALVHAPRLLILDEPLTGLDAGAARQAKDVLVERVRAGVTVIMTTHILEGLAQAERIGVIEHGYDRRRHARRAARTGGNAGTTPEEVFRPVAARRCGVAARWPGSLARAAPSGAISP
jgi:ABC-2 type transport system ATP-binding protein